MRMMLVRISGGIEQLRVNIIFPYLEMLRLNVWSKKYSMYSARIINILK